MQFAGGSGCHAGPPLCDRRAYQACRRTMCVSPPSRFSNDSLLSSKNSVYHIGDAERESARRKRAHRRAIRLQYVGKTVVKRLPGGGIPERDDWDTRLVSIEPIALAFERHTRSEWAWRARHPDEFRRLEEPRTDGWYATDEPPPTRHPATPWPLLVHTEPQGSCIACCALPECSVPTVGLTPASAEPTYSEGPEVARARWTRYKRRATYHDAKKWPKDRGNVLLQRELTAAVHTQEREDRCCSKVATLERRIPFAGVLVERCQVPMRCGLRRCKDCLKLKKLVAAPRMIGPWKQFVTMTLPHNECSALHAWRHASEWMTEVADRLRSRVKKGTRQCVAWNCQNRGPHPEIRVDSGRLEYAWVVEPHKDGYPHWHLVWNANFVCYDYLREVWDDVAGYGISHMQVRKVKTPESISRYLIKYLNKAIFPPEVLACTYRRRLWATTVKRPPKWELGYQVIGFQDYRNSSVDPEKQTWESSSLTMGVDAKLSSWSIVQRIPGVVARILIIYGGQSIREEWSPKYSLTPLGAESAQIPSSWMGPITADAWHRSRKYLTPDFADLERLERTWYDPKDQHADTA
jgi:hypothetical protein